MLMRLFMALVLVLIASSVSAQMYQWVDKNGVVHMTDVPPQGAANNLKIIKDDDILDSPKRVFLNKLYTRESFEAEKERLKKEIAYYEQQCREDSKSWPTTTQNWDSYCESNKQRSKRSYDVLTSDPDRYFFVKNANKSKTWPPGGYDSPYYQPWE